MRCLAKDPDDRFQTMKELHVAIERALAEISDHGARLTATAMDQTPLGTGFHSQYDVNRGRDFTTGGESWFVDSLSVPASSISDEWEAAPVPPRRNLGRVFVFAAALFVGIVGGLNATSYALGNNRNAGEPPMPIATAGDDFALPAVAVTHETVAPEPVADLEQDEEQPLEVAPTEATVERPKVIRPPRPHVMKRPQPRRHVPAQQDDENEDLYDAR
jgi:hypothetical protein